MIALIKNMSQNTEQTYLQDSDEENPFDDDIGGNIVSFNDMDASQMANKAGGGGGNVAFIK